ncbi:MAG: EamA family transporter [Ferruginibacter sp.]
MNTTINGPVKKIAGISLPILALMWVSIAWGSTWIASKIGIRQVPALQLCAMRQIIAGLIWISFFVIRKHSFPDKQQWKIILLLALFNFTLSNALSTWGIHYISAGLGAILAAIFPLWIVIIYFLKRQKIALLAVLGMLMGFAGVCIIFYDHLKDFMVPGFSFGILISVIATITWAIGSVYTQKEVDNFNPYFGLGLQMLISGIFLYPVAKITGQTIPLAAINGDSWLALCYLILVGSIATFAAYVYTLKHLPIAVASVYAYINPVVAVLLGIYIFKERITMGILAGGAVILAGVYLVNYATKNNKE